MSIILVNALDADSVRMLLGRKIDLGIPYGLRRNNWPVLLFEMEDAPAFLMRDMYPRLADLKQAAEVRTGDDLGLTYARLSVARPRQACIVTIGQLQRAIPQAVNYERPSMFTTQAYDAATRQVSCQRISEMAFLLAPHSAFWVEIGVEGQLPDGSPVTVPVRSMSTFCPRAVSQRLGGAYEPQGLEGRPSGTPRGYRPPAPAAPMHMLPPPAAPVYRPSAPAAPAYRPPIPVAPGYPPPGYAPPGYAPPGYGPNQFPWQTPPPGTPIF